MEDTANSSEGIFPPGSLHSFSGENPVLGTVINEMQKSDYKVGSPVSHDKKRLRYSAH